MQVAIIAANNLRYSPYIFFYTDIMERAGIAYEVIYPNRNGLDERFSGTAHVLPWRNHLPAIVNYARYAAAVKKVVKRRKYDALIVLTGVNAAYLGSWLKRNYAGKYIVDIRDYSHENIHPYYRMESIAVKHSLLNVISSKRFTQFLPKAEYSICHNCNQEDAKRAAHSFSKAHGHIRIGYVGALSYIDQCERLMNLVAKDERFSLDYYGTSKAEPVLQAYAQRLACNRICFHGAYSPRDKAAILPKVDILFNAYGHGIPLLDCALSNKLYDALIYKKPILTCPNTYMTEIAGVMAFPIELAESGTLDALYDWYMGIDGKVLVDDADGLLAEILHEHAMTQNKVAAALLALEA